MSDIVITTPPTPHHPSPIIVTYDLYGNGPYQPTGPAGRVVHVGPAGPQEKEKIIESDEEGYVTTITTTVTRTRKPVVKRKAVEELEEEVARLKKKMNIMAEDRAIMVANHDKELSSLKSTYQKAIDVVGCTLNIVSKFWYENRKRHPGGFFMSMILSAPSPQTSGAYLDRLKATVRLFTTCRTFYFAMLEQMLVVFSKNVSKTDQSAGYRWISLWKDQYKPVDPLTIFNKTYHKLRNKSIMLDYKLIKP